MFSTLRLPAKSLRLTSFRSWPVTVKSCTVSPAFGKLPLTVMAIAAESYVRHCISPLFRPGQRACQCIGVALKIGWGLGFGRAHENSVAELGIVGCEIEAAQYALSLQRPQHAVGGLRERDDEFVKRGAVEDALHAVHRSETLAQRHRIRVTCARDVRESRGPTSAM